MADEGLNPRTGWWSWNGPNCQPPTQSSNRSLTSESGTEFFAAETGQQNGPIHPDCGSSRLRGLFTAYRCVNAFHSRQKGSGHSLYQVVSVVRTGSRSVLMRQTVLACFDPLWPNLIFAVAYFEILAKKQKAPGRDPSASAACEAIGAGGKPRRQINCGRNPQ